MHPTGEVGIGGGIQILVSHSELTVPPKRASLCGFTRTTGAGLAGSPAPSSPLQSPGPGSVSTCAQMSRVAPIPSIECLMSEAHLNELIQEESATITSADMKSERMKEVRVLFVPLADLEKEGTQAFNAINKRKNDYVAGDAGTSSGGGQQQSIKMQLLRSCEELGDEVAMASIQDMTTANFQRPFVMRKYAEHFTGTFTTKSYDQWTRDFKKSVLDKGVAGRRTLEMESGTAQEVAEVIKRSVFEKAEVFGIIGNLASCPEAAGLKAALFSTLGPKYFAPTPGWETATLEKDYFGSLRVSLDGSRCVVAFEFQAAHKHCVEMLRTSADQVPDVQPSTVVGTVKAFSKEDVQKFVQMNGNPGVFRAVVGPADALYLPQGYVFCEANMLRVNYGITIPAIIKGDCLESLSFCNNYLARRGHPNPDLHAAVDELKAVVRVPPTGQAADAKVVAPPAALTGLVTPTEEKKDEADADKTVAVNHEAPATEEKIFTNIPEC